MKIEIKLSIPTLLRKFDEHFITSNDIETLAVVRNFITSMREQVPEGTTATRSRRRCVRRWPAP